ncbi:MAG: hypothetical protein EOP01_00125 [Propionibacteriaceae bacterium]|nr:MAG: hypothetical protein EOP01_00125 [Propionibacteriaceae bacterium]
MGSGITVLSASQLLFEFSSADKIDVKQGLIPDADKSDGENDKSDGSGHSLSGITELGSAPTLG